MDTLDVYRTVDHQEAQASAMLAFLRFCERQTQRTFPDYAAFQAWATSEYPRFWQLFARWIQFPFSGSDEPAVCGDGCEHTHFFPTLRLNYARCLLRNLGSGSEGRTAVLGVAESGERRSLTRFELRDAVERCAAGLVHLGVQSGDQVVALARNAPEAIISCLACTAVGAIWSSIAPDVGEAVALERFKQLSAVLLFASTEFSMQGATHALQDRIDLLGRELPTLRWVVALDQGERPPKLRTNIAFISIEQLMREGRLGIEQWMDFPFDQPLFVLFSSGTTGAPKCLVHGAGGTLIEHYKEHVLHSSFGIGERLCFQTSAGWMMWNWQLSALACGTEIVLFDGSPTFPTQDALLTMINREKVTVFGTSATYLHAVQQVGISPTNIGAFADLHTIQSTGSILYDTQFDWIASEFNSVKIQSISGGTDVVGCFVLGNPLLPIYRGESQCVSLGLDVRVMTAEGLCRCGEGELVCVNPFPSRPIGILGDANGRRFHEAYFAENPGIWTHGDCVRLSERGSARVLGRSDGILNVRGVRIGPAEIYSIVLAMPGIVHALAVEQRTPREPGGSRLVLLLVLEEGVTLDRALTLRIKKDLRQRGSPNHVPAVIVQVKALPMTHTGKFSEKVVRDLLNGNPLSNRGAIKNPESLHAIAAHPQLQPER